MARYVLRVCAIAAAAAILAGCGEYGSIVEVLRGNFAYSRGDYQSALVHYMVAAEDAPNDAWTRFNIGNVYYALGEHTAALEVWNEARSAVESDEIPGATELALIFATSYNRGVLLYQQGQYTEAYDELRYALSVNSGSVDAKANLELALRKLQAADSAAGIEAEDGAAGLSEAQPGSDDEPGEQTLRILEYVRRKETQQWFANRELDTEEQPRDW